MYLRFNQKSTQQPFLYIPIYVRIMQNSKCLSINSKSNFLLFRFNNHQDQACLKTFKVCFFFDGKLITMELVVKLDCPVFQLFVLKDKMSWSVLRAVILPLSVQSKIQLIQSKTNQLWFLYICCIQLFLSMYNTLANVHTYIILYFKWHSILILNLF